MNNLNKGYFVLQVDVYGTRPLVAWFVWRSDAVKWAKDSTVPGIGFDVRHESEAGELVFSTVEQVAA